MVKKFIEDINDLDLLNSEKEILNYSKKLTVKPSEISEEDINRLRRYRIEG